MRAVDYCPHCACTHVIGEHPRDNETRADYWRRIRESERRSEQTERALARWRHGMKQR